MNCIAIIKPIFLFGEGSEQYVGVDQRRDKAQGVRGPKALPNTFLQ